MEESRPFRVRSPRWRGRAMAVPVAAFWVSAALGLAAAALAAPPRPTLDNNPSRDVVLTNRRPLLTLNNPDGGERFTYDIELDTDPRFDPPTVSYSGVAPHNPEITSRRVARGDALEDHTTYHWRARTVAADGTTSAWVRSRFRLDTSADDRFMGLVRVPVAGVEVSSGSAPESTVDINDFGAATYWQSTPPGSSTQWVRLDLGKVTEVSRLWLLSSPESELGRLRDFHWSASRDGRSWHDIPGAAVEESDTFRHTLDFEPVEARFLMLTITDWEGYAAQVNSIRVYSPGRPPVPAPPAAPYVLVVGNQQNGGTFSELARRIRSLDLGLETLTVPYYEVSLEMLEHLEPAPVAVVLSGSLSGYSEIPMFEYNGEYEIIRHAELPILGICAGHQQLAMAHGYSFVRGMGWDDVGSLEPPRRRTETRIVEQAPIFRSVPDPFVGVEVHSWSVAVLPPGYELLARSSYVQVIRHAGQRHYGTQFHPEIRRPWNEAEAVLENFLSEALAVAGESGDRDRAAHR